MDSKELKILVISLSAIALVGFVLSAVVAVMTMCDQGLFNSSLCLNNECVGFFLKSINSAIDIANATLKLLVSGNCSGPRAPRFVLM
uniref:Uncharacterized protein n=1 Tax=mine drainage metagenome TaxID=410659 RepID=E6QDZ4_9ZZZZ